MKPELEWFIREMKRATPTCFSPSTFYNHEPFSFFWSSPYLSWEMKRWIFPLTYPHFHSIHPIFSSGPILISNPKVFPFYNPPLWSKIEKKHKQNSNLINHFPTSEGVSEVSERANEWAQRRARAKRTVLSKRTSERCKQTSKRTS